MEAIFGHTAAEVWVYGPISPVSGSRIRGGAIVQGRVSKDKEKEGAMEGSKKGREAPWLATRGDTVYGAALYYRYVVRSARIASFNGGSVFFNLPFVQRFWEQPGLLHRSSGGL